VYEGMVLGSLVLVKCLGMLPVLLLVLMVLLEVPVLGRGVQDLLVVQEKVQAVLVFLGVQVRREGRVLGLSVPSLGVFLAVVLLALVVCLGLRLVLVV